MQGTRGRRCAFLSLILLDTNVVSALMQTNPDRHVIAWLDQQPIDEVWLPSVVVFELRYGLSSLEPGARRRRLEQALDQLLSSVLRERIAALNGLAARRAAELAGQRKRQGTPVDLRDTLIAGIALATQATLVTRNVRHFLDLEVPVINPFGVDS
jgi:predicted nucleic acid-binding protein